MPNTKVPCQKLIQIKKKFTDSEMKEYAETAMNELLSWYGYNKLEVNNDVQAVNLASPYPRTSTSSPVKRNPIHLDLPHRRKSKPASFSAVSPCSPLSSCSSSSSLPSISPPPSRSTGSTTSSVNKKMADVVDVNDKDDLFSLINQMPASESNEGVSCSWCRMMNCTSKNYTFETAKGYEQFCSEVCFSHYRRANFRRNKRCDWCRHIRNSVNYVDLQDGDNQYQFCSDKCLNQFKLDIFCQETKEHLDIHPYHRDQLQNTADSSASLITPDMWLRNCTSPRDSAKSRSASPTTDHADGLPLHIYTSGSLSKITRSAITNDSILAISKFPKKPTKKKKKLQPLRTSVVRDLSKKDDSVFSFSSESPTPKISFQPNFSSMLPSETKRMSCDSKAANKSFQSTSLPVPPLLPIGKNNEFSRPTTSTPTWTATTTTSTSPSTSTLFSGNSTLPLPTVLVPYPVLLPIILPFPIPIPIPIPTSEKSNGNDPKNSTEGDKKKSDNLDN